MTLETIKKAVKQLSPSERAALANSLLEDIDNTALEEKETEIEKIWLDEAERRSEAYKSGFITSSSFDEAIERVRTNIAK